jgi:3'-5' exoribonuclease
MNITEQLRRKMDNKEMNWTDYQRSLERYLYLGGFGDKNTGDEVMQPNNSRQPSLF